MNILSDNVYCPPGTVGRKERLMGPERSVGVVVESQNTRSERLAG